MFALPRHLIARHTCRAQRSHQCGLSPTKVVARLTPRSPVFPTSFKPYRLAVLFCAVVALAALLAGCGSGSGSSSTSSTSSADTASATTGGSDWTAELQKLYKGTYTNPPSTSPKPSAGKNIWVISLGQAVPSAAIAASGAQRAGKALGWNVKVWDGKTDPNAQLAGIRSAVNQKADSIMLVYIDCATVEQGLKEAHAAGIKIVALESYDCSETKKGAPSYFDYVTTYNGIKFPQYIANWSAAAQTWNVVQAKEKAEVAVFYETDLKTDRIVGDSAIATLKKCSTCEKPVVVKWTYADQGPKLQQKTSQAFLQNPDITGTSVTADGVITGGVLGGIRDAGQQGKVKVMGGECVEENLNLIRNHQGQDACVGLPTAWEAYAAMDGLNRLFNKQDPYQAKTGIGLIVVDQAHNLTPSGPFKPPVDFESAYAKTWAAAKG